MSRAFKYPPATFLILFSAFVFVSCNRGMNEGRPNAESEPEQIDIRLPAMFTGTLPCADCPGIDYRIIIEEDRFVEISNYQDRSPGTFEQTGKWKMSGDTLSLVQENFTSTKKFLVNEDTLTLLDQDNHRVTGELADMYTLERVGNQPAIREHHEDLARKGQKFFAGGNEPFWSVTVDSADDIIFETPEEAKRFSEADSADSNASAVLEAATDSTRIMIQTEKTYCQDSMSGYLFPLEVTVFLQATEKDTLTGCGLFLNG